MGDIPWYLWVGVKFHYAVSFAFFKWATVLYKRPWIGILIFAVLTASLLPLQYVLQDTENRIEKLWIPQDSVALTDREYVLDVYGASSRFETALFFDPDGDNVLTHTNLQYLFRVHEAVRSTTVVIDGATIGFDDLCTKYELVGTNSLDCFHLGALSFWNFNETRMLEDTDLLKTVSNESHRDQFGAPVDWKFVLGPGDVPLRNEAGEFTKIPSLALVYQLQQSPNAEAWEDAYIENILALDFPQARVLPLAEKSFADAVDNSLSEDTYLVFIAVGLIFTYTCIFLGSFDKHFVATKIILASVGVGAVFAGTYTAYGLMALIGVKNVSVNEVIIFLIMGVGVDDMFVLSNEVAQTPRSWKLSKQFAVGISHAGSSIALTSLTNMVAFGIGSSTSLFAIRSFCLYAMTAVGVDFIFQMTLFCGYMVLDLKRARSRRKEFCFCVKGPEKKHVKPTHESFGQKIVRVYYGPFITKLPVKIGILIFFGAIFGVGIWGAIQIRQDFQESSLFLKDSYQYEYSTIDSRYNSNRPATGALYVKTVQYESLGVQDTILDLVSELADDKYIETIGVNWLADLRAFGNSTSGDDFYPTLEAFLSIPAYKALYDGFLVFDSAGILIGSQVPVTFVKMATSDLQVSAMGSTRAVVARFDIDAVMFGFEMIFWEQFAVIITEAVSNLLLVLVVVFFVTLFFLIHPLTALLVTFVIAIVDVDLLAMMVFWDLNIDSVTVVNLVMAIGFAVDYSVHIAHSFMTKSGTRNERVQKALHSMSISVLSGGASTFIGIFVLVFGRSEIFYIFFKMFLGSIVFGLMHGLIFLPVVLSLVGPPAFSEDVMAAIAVGNDHSDDSEYSLD